MLPQPWYIVFITSRVDYCNTALHRVSPASVQPLQNMLNAAARIILRKRKFDHITTDVRDRLHWLPVQQRIEHKVRVHSRCISVCIRLANIPRWTVLTCVWISQWWSPPFSCSGDLAVPRSRTARYGQRCLFLVLVQHAGIRSHCPFVIHHWHWLSSVRVWRLCYSAEHTKH